METGICYKYFATFSIISYDTLKKIDNISWILKLCISCQFKSLQRMGIKLE
jgi:hypothetical protein